METKVLEEKKNVFLDRTEYKLEIKNESTPTEMEVKEALGKDVDLTVVKEISSNFGRQFFIVRVVVYDSLESKEKIEVIPKKVRAKMAKEKAEAEAAAKKAEEEAKKAEEEAKAAEEAAKSEGNEENAEEKSE